MKCPICEEHTGVVDTQKYSDIRAIRRRRECPIGHRFSTLEFPVPEQTTVKTAAKLYNDSVDIGIRYRMMLEILAAATAVARKDLEEM